MLDQLCEEGRSIPQIQEDKNFLRMVKPSKTNWICHILHISCILKHSIEVKIEDQTRNIM
jgi:hypothetical protein